MFRPLVKWFAGKILRRRRYSPRCLVAKRLSSWAAREIGREGRERWNTERRRRAAFAWADKDEARRNTAHAAFLVKQASLTELATAQREAEAMRMERAARSLMLDVFGQGGVMMIDGADAVQVIDAETFTILSEVHRNVAPLRMRIH